MMYNISQWKRNLENIFRDCLNFLETENKRKTLQ